MCNYKEFWCRMIFYTFFVFAVIIVSIAIVGCSSKAEECKPIKEVVVTTEVVEKKIPVGCQFPEIHCSFKGDGYEVTENMLKCLKMQKELIEACRADLSKWKE